MESKTINGDIILNKNVYKDIVSIITSKEDVFYPTKKDNGYINVDNNENGLTLTLHLKIKQGVDVVEKCSNLQNEIYDNVKLMTGIEVKKVNLDIVGFVK